MVGINLDPQVGAVVYVQGHSGRFRITRVDACTDNPRLTRFYGCIDVEELRTGFKLVRIPVGALIYDEDRPVHRAIEWLKTNPERPYPGYVDGYEVEAGEDHEGNPAFFIRFFVDPENIYQDGQPSEGRIEELNQFLGVVQTTLRGLSLDPWPYVRVSEKWRLLDVAS